MTRLMHRNSRFGSRGLWLLAGVACANLATGAAWAKSKLRMDDSLKIATPPGWQIIKQELSHSLPGEYRYGILTYSNGARQIVLAYGVYSTDPSARVLQQRLFSARDTLSSASIKRVTKARNLELVDFVKVHRRRTGSSRRVVGMWFRKDLVEGMVTSPTVETSTTASVQSAFASFRADLLRSAKPQQQRQPSVGRIASEARPGAAGR